MQTKRESPSAGRRHVLLGLAALLAAAATGRVDAQRAPAPLYDPARFDNLSRALTGYALQDAATASELLAALRSAVGADALRRIATLAAVIPGSELTNELRIAGLARQAEILITALYTGVVETPKGSRVLTYDNALIWQALPWTKPNMVCGGVTNYWTDPPVNATR